jgi:tRNA(fMet)-specific endonuclease VapC
VRWLLDTDTCVWLLRGREEVVARVSGHSPDDLAVASMTLAELRYGALRSTAREAQERRVELLAGSLAAVLPFDEPAARTHAELRHALRATPIGERDLVIASVAVSARLTLVTGNVREFRRVPGLAVEDWAAG